MTDLSQKERMFCHEYIIDFNATRAAIAAGYSEKTAYSAGGRLLKDVDIKKYISELKQKRQEEVDFTAAEVLRKLSILSRASLKKFVKPDGYGGFKMAVPKEELSDDDMYCISEITTEEVMSGYGDDAIPVRKTKIKLVDRLKALELAGKHTDVQAYKERLALEGDLNISLSDRLSRAAERIGDESE